MLDHGCAILNRRLRAMTAPTDDDLMTITFGDMSEALERVPQPPPEEDDELGDASAGAKAAYAAIGKAMKAGDTARAVQCTSQLKRALQL